MRKARLSTGFELPLDGDLLALVEALYKEVTLKNALQVFFEDMMREIRGLVEQMSEEEKKRYLVESLFLNSVTYENEMLINPAAAGCCKASRAGHSWAPRRVAPCPAPLRRRPGQGTLRRRPQRPARAATTPARGS